MILTKKNSTMLIGLMTLVVAASCGKKKDSEPAAAAEQPESVADLKLSSALNLSIPDDLAAAAGGTASTGLNLTGAKLTGKKSSEACRTMENVNRVFENLQEVGGMFCHFEVEADKMKFGTKYNIEIAGESRLAGKAMNIWVDNSDTAELKVYMCEDGALKEKITISGFGGEGKAKGSMVHKYSHTEGGSTQTGGINLDFDFTQAGFKIVKAKMKHASEGGQYAGTYRNFADIKLADSGISTVKLSSVGTRGTDTFSDQAEVLFNGTLGQALFSGAGVSSFGTYDWTSRSTFNKDGITVAKTEASADLTVAKADLPEKLASDFSPDVPAGWDCSGATESFTIDMTDPAKKTAHDACSGDHSRSFSGCWGEDFEQGEHE